MMKTQKKTKIVATIGPASENKETLRKMIENGLNVARLNFSHGEYSWHQKTIDDLRSLSEEMGIPVGIIADLQGPRIRTMVEGELEIVPGENIFVYDQLTKDNAKSKIEDSKSIGLDYPGIIADIEVGNVILIEDGLKSVKVIQKEDTYLKAEVIDGGIIKNHKGVNIPDAKMSIPPITEKDERDLEFALKNEVDFVAMSFVSKAQEIMELRERIKKILGREINLPHIIPKIERKEAIQNLDEIIEASDAVMVARGDLGIEMNETKVAILQKEIIAKSLLNLKPVIVATEMLSSMIENPRPTRAEVSDVTNAVIDHADAVMLSGESANGKYPVEVIRTMAEIISNTEESPYDDMCNPNINHRLSTEYVNFIQNTCNSIADSGAKAIAIMSRGGFTSRVIAHFRPRQIILSGTCNLKTYFQSSLKWGVRGFFFEECKIDNMTENLLKKAEGENILGKGDKVVLIGKDEEKDTRMVDVKEIK